MSVEITVRGTFTAFRPPERGTVRLQIGLEGAQAAEVNAGVAQQAQRVSDSVRRLHRPDAGPVTWWSSSQLRSWADRPWNQDGKQLPLRHHAAVDLQAKFSDFTALGTWLAEVMDLRGVSVLGIEWTLTERHKRELVGEVRARAVRDARDKAEQYAAALGLDEVVPVALADAGMLGQGLEARGGQEAMMFSRAAAQGHGGIDLAPGDVSVSIDVDARFAAGPRAPEAGGAASGT